MRDEIAVFTDTRGAEAVGWMLAACLLILAFWLPEAAAPSRLARLMAVVAGLVVVNLFAHRSPPSWDGALAYRPDDKALAIGLVTTSLLGLYLYILSGASSSLDALFLLPLIGATLASEPRVVAFEALLSAIVLVLLRAAGPAEVPVWTTEFVMRLVAFSAVSVSLAAMTAAMRRARSEAGRLSVGLARRVGEFQALGALARQSGRMPDLDALVAGAGRIIAEAAGSERSVVFLTASGGDGFLPPFGDRRDRETLELEENAAVLRGVLETGTARILDAVPSGEARIRDMLVLPLRNREAPIGVICLLNRRDDDVFREEQVVACEPLTAFAAGLLQGALTYRHADEERHAVARMSKVLVGRELKMRELKRRRREPSGV